MLAKILDGLIDFVCMVVTAMLGLLPNSPFIFDATIWPEWVQSVGVVIPVPGMVTHMTAFITAAGLYILIRWILRFVKAIQ